MISKEKQILKESYDKRNQNVINTKSLMDRMMNYRLGELKKSRTEQYKNNVKEFKNQGETFDTDKLKINQTMSPTTKSPSHSFSRLYEQRKSEYEIELEQIKQELE
jgi:hypothetical protein